LGGDESQDRHHGDEVVAQIIKKSDQGHQQTLMGDGTPWLGCAAALSSVSVSTSKLEPADQVPLA